MGGLTEVLGLSPPQIAGLVAVAILTLCVWRRYFSAISDIPGPFAASFTRLWHIQRILKGDQNLELIRLHQKHGEFLLTCIPPRRRRIMASQLADPLSRSLRPHRPQRG